MPPKPIHDSPRSKVVIIGIGNEFRCDDAIGLVVADNLRKKLSESISILLNSGDGIDLLEQMQSGEIVLLIDAICSERKPGDIIRVDLSKQDFPLNNKNVSSTHVFGIGEAIQMAKVLGKIPQQLIFYGIEGMSFEFGQTISPHVLPAAEIAAERIAAEIGMVGKNSNGLSESYQKSQK